MNDYFSTSATPTPDVDFSPDAGFTIGAVSHITGIPVGTLRIWERRYGGALPHRGENNRRQYTQAEVTRLTLIRQLVEKGHAVGSVARLTAVELQQRLAFHAQESSVQPASATLPRVMVFGETLVFALGSETMDWGDVQLYAVFAEFEKAAMTGSPEVLVAEWMSVTVDNLRDLNALMKRSAARRGLVVYTYASREVLAQAARWGMVALQAPLAPGGLAAACRRTQDEHQVRMSGMQGQGGDVPPRQFTNETLVHLSRQSADMVCECPRHLSELVLKLSAFEAYSLDCETRDRINRERHQVLYRITADARALMESALTYLLQEEPVPDHDRVG